MKINILLILAVLFVTGLNYYQSRVIQQQRLLIRQMMKNPKCLMDQDMLNKYKPPLISDN